MTTPPPKVAYSKRWMSVADQVTLLESRGLIIDDRPLAEAFLGYDIAPPGPAHVRGSVACYRYSGPLGHKPLKLISARANPINPRKPELK